MSKKLMNKAIELAKSQAAYYMQRDETAQEILEDLHLETDDHEAALEAAGKAMDMIDDRLSHPPRLRSSAALDRLVPDRTLADLCEESDFSIVPWDEGDMDDRPDFYAGDVTGTIHNAAAKVARLLASCKPGEDVWWVSAAYANGEGYFYYKGSLEEVRKRIKDLPEDNGEPEEE